MTEHSLKNASLYFQLNSDKCCKGMTVGSEMNYDLSTKKWDTRLGAHINNEDHSWKLRLHDTGLMRLALQWKLHQVCKATVDTSVDLP